MPSTTLHFFYVFVLFFSVETMLSQSAKIDSLKIELQSHTEKDTSRIKLLNNLANTLYNTKNFDQAMVHLDESEKLSDSLDYAKGKAKSLRLKGMVYRDQSKFNKAFQYLNDALQLNKAKNYTSDIARCYNGIGATFYYKGDKNEAIKYYKKSVEIFKKIDNNKAVAIITNNIGRAYSDLGDYPNATKYYQKSLALHKQLDNEIGMAFCFNNLGLILAYKGNYLKALDYYDQSLKIAKSNNNSWLINATLGNIGTVYQRQENYDKALIYYEQILSNLKNTDKKFTAFTLNNMGLLYKSKKNYEEALETLKNAVKIHQEMHNKFDIISPLNNIGDVYLDTKQYKSAYANFNQAKKIGLEVKNQRSLCNSYLGLAKIYLHQKQYNNALDNALMSKKISNELKLVDYQRDVHQLLVKIYTAKGNYKNALINHQQFKKLNDSLFNKKNIEKITALEYEYKYQQALDSANIRELELKRTVTSTNQSLQKSQRNLLLGVIIFLTIILLLTAIIFFLKLRNERSKTQNIIIEQKLLRSQMTPHFIFNSLSVLQGLILNKEEKKSITYLSKFSKLLRTILENSRHKSVVLSEELSAIKNYISLQNLDVNPPFNFNLTVASNINQSSLKIPPMLIQPFIENAIEHAFPNKKEKKEINIDLRFKNKELICTIEDNGIGIALENQNSNKVKKSLATTITSERLKMLAKNYKTPSFIKVENREKYNKKGTLVTLIIPYKKIENL